MPDEVATSLLLAALDAAQALSDAGGSVPYFTLFLGAASRVLPPAAVPPLARLLRSGAAAADGVDPDWAHLAALLARVAPAEALGALEEVLARGNLDTLVSGRYSTSLLDPVLTAIGLESNRSAVLSPIIAALARQPESGPAAELLGPLLDLTQDSPLLLDCARADPAQRRLVIAALESQPHGFWALVVPLLEIPGMNDDDRDALAQTAAGPRSGAFGAGTYPTIRQRIEALSSERPEHAEWARTALDYVPGVDLPHEHDDWHLWDFPHLESRDVERILAGSQTTMQDTIVRHLLCNATPSVALRHLRHSQVQEGLDRLRLPPEKRAFWQRWLELKSRPETRVS